VAYAGWLLLCRAWYWTGRDNGNRVRSWMFENWLPFELYMWRSLRTCFNFGVTSASLARYSFYICTKHARKRTKGRNTRNQSLLIDADQAEQCHSSLKVPYNSALETLTKGTLRVRSAIRALLQEVSAQATCFVLRQYAMPSGVNQFNTRDRLQA
jgi:hypothetical protein